MIQYRVLQNCISQYNQTHQDDYISNWIEILVHIINIVNGFNCNFEPHLYQILLKKAFLILLLLLLLLFAETWFANVLVILKNLFVWNEQTLMVDKWVFFAEDFWSITSGKVTSIENKTLYLTVGKINKFNRNSMIGESIYQLEHWVVTIGHDVWPIGWICGMYTEDLPYIIPGKLISNSQSTIKNGFVRVSYQKQQLPMAAMF